MDGEHVKGGAVTRVRVEVEADSEGERVLAQWLRSWRRRGARADGETQYLYQGASLVKCFRAPAEAVGELEMVLSTVSGASVTRVPAAG